MTLDPCPSSPNCVSSLSEPTDAVHYVEALAINESADTVLDAVAACISEAGGSVTDRSADTMTALFTSKLFRFKDDVSFFVDESNRRLHARSASRTGYSDLGVNRKRISALFGQIDAKLNSAES